ncbi:MAG: hypothetical protein K8R31_11670 [Bacteroidales bacterium]|nr:hypothetical protein [Bacteroidales bacterium]
MKFFSTYITPKIILNILLGLAVFGMIFILFTVNRMNSLLNTDIGFNKDSVISIKTEKSAVILHDTLVFSSELPGFNTKSTIEVRSEYIKNDIKIAHQYISEDYLDFFNYKKLNEKPSLFLDHGNAQLIYLNESAVDKLGIYCIDDVPGTKIRDKYNNELIICGVIENCSSLTLRDKNQPKIYQLTSEHLAYAFYATTDNMVQLEENNLNVNQSGIITFQQRIQNRYKIWEDIVYSAFLFINVIILLICLGYIGNKYAYRKERELFTILGIGIHVLTLVISKTYIYLIAIIGLVVGPLAFLIQKLWLEIYINRINFGLIDLFIILSMALLTAYLVCCPKRKLEDQLKTKSIQFNSI